MVARSSGTVTDPVRTVHYQVGRWSVAAAQVLLVAGALAAAVALLRPPVPWWLLPAAVGGAVVALLGLGSGRGLPGRLGSGLVRLVRPDLVPGVGGRSTRAERFDLVHLDGTRVTCECLGPARRRSPPRGVAADVYGRPLPDGAIRVRRVVHGPTAVSYRPRAEIGLVLARLGTGAGVVVGAGLVLASLLVMTQR